MKEEKAKGRSMRYVPVLITNRLENNTFLSTWHLANTLWCIY